MLNRIFWERRHENQYEATQSKSGAVCGICENGKKLGVKPGEFELVEDDA